MTDQKEQSLVERVAAAEAKVDGYDDLICLCRADREQYRRRARAAIAAMREPTEYMIAIAESMSDLVQLDACGPNTVESRREEWRLGWGHAIDAALYEEKNQERK